MKFLTTFITITAFSILCSVEVSAQRVAIPSSFGMPAPYYPYPAYGQHLKKQFLGDWKYGLEFASYVPYTFRVTLKDGTQKVIKSPIFPEVNGHRAYLSVINRHLAKSDPNRTTKIYPSDTQYIDLLSNDSLAILNGLPTDSCWLFPLVEGKIKVFSYLPEKEYLAEYSLIAFQIGDAPIKPWDPRALDGALKSDEKAYKYFLKKRYYDAILKYDATH